MIRTFLLYIERVFYIFNEPKTKNRVGIVSDFSYDNYGNKLQGFALRKLLLEKGYKSFILTNHSTGHFRIRKFLSLFGYPIDQKEYSIYKAFIKYEGKPFIYRGGKRQIKKLNEAKMIIFGSDQLWNYEYNLKNFPFNLGEFKKDLDKVPFYMYGVSIGNYLIPSKIMDSYLSQVSNFEKISFREIENVEYFNKCGVICSTALDPTLLIYSLWEEIIAKKITKIVPADNYVLKFFLGPNSFTNEEYDNIIDLADINSSFYSANQYDAINLVKHSSLVITDSFHLFIFCLIYHKRFIIYSRPDHPGMDIRFTSLAKALNLNFKFNEEMLLDINDLSTNQLYLDSYSYLFDILK